MTMLSTPTADQDLIKDSTTKSFMADGRRALLPQRSELLRNIAENNSSAIRSAAEAASK